MKNFVRETRLNAVLLRHGEPYKCQVVHFCGKSTLPNVRLKLGLSELDWRETTKYLEVKFERNFTWNLSVHQMVDVVKGELGPGNQG